MFDFSRYWYRKPLHFSTFPLLPFSWLFGIGAAFRRSLYHVGLIKSHRFHVPLIIVGNITVGGTGKTPFVIWLAGFLKAQGYSPGIVSRGVGGAKHVRPHRVSLDDPVQTVGDEALLLAQNTDCPVVIGIDRVAAVRDLLQHSECNLVISDDGLQHYRLARDIEIAIVDGARRFGNGHLLPVGPLREPEGRLNKVDFIIVNEGNQSDEFTMALNPMRLISLKDKRQCMLSEFPHKKAHAIAGIGNPARFFNTLQNAGFEIVPHAFPDHYLYQSSDVDFNDSLPIIMTGKDAVKCVSFADERYWYLEIAVKIDCDFEQKLLTKLKYKGDLQ